MTTPAPRASGLGFDYRIVLADGSEVGMELALDPDTLTLLAPRPEQLPEWTVLGHRQCSNCPLSAEEHPHCPIAANLVEVVERFGKRTSYEPVEVTVSFRNRRYVKHTALQEAVSSLVGIIMVTSGCPVMDRLRPMVDTHLPFMSADEVCYRVITMYLFAQLFVARRGGDPDWELRRLPDVLEEIRKTNAGMAGRLRSLGIADANLNALSILNAQGEIARFVLDEDELGRWQTVFENAFRHEPAAD